MPISASVQMTLISFEVIPAPLLPPPGGETGISATLTFQCAQPGPGMPAIYTIILTSADLATINAAPNKQTALQTTVIDHLQKQLRPASPVASVLASFVGQSVTV